MSDSRDAAVVVNGRSFLRIDGQIMPADGLAVNPMERQAVGEALRGVDEMSEAETAYSVDSDPLVDAVKSELMWRDDAHVLDKDPALFNKAYAEKRAEILKERGPDPCAAAAWNTRMQELQTEITNRKAAKSWKDLDPERPLRRLSDLELVAEIMAMEENQPEGME